MTVYTLWLVWRSRLAHQSDLGSKAPGFGVLQESRHGVVVEVIDQIPHPGVVRRSQLVGRQRRQRGTQGPGAAEITVAGRAQWQLGLRKQREKRIGCLIQLVSLLVGTVGSAVAASLMFGEHNRELNLTLTLLSCNLPSAISSLTASSAAS